MANIARTIPICKELKMPHQSRTASQLALERLYQRRAAVEAAIRSLESYARCQETAQVVQIPIQRN